MIIRIIRLIKGVKHMWVLEEGKKTREQSTEDKA
jgi:hypothetical protein